MALNNFFIMDTIEVKLKKFLNLYWLRPENGLLTTFKSHAISSYDFEGPSMDLSCGDGLFMFLHLGGILDDEVDYFISTKAKDFSHSKEFIDIYDSYSEDYFVKIKKNPETKIDYGLDLKQQLLNKASKLDIYTNLVCHDNTNPLPFEENTFNFIHSNSVYWVNNPEKLLSEILRILKPGGKAILELMTPYHHQTYSDISSFLSEQAISILDRNRRSSMPGVKTYNEWTDIITKCGFEISNASSVYPNRLIVDISNIGLRPISHLLIQMSQYLPKEKRIELKQEWVNIFYELFKPLLTLSDDSDLDVSPYVLYELTKK